MGRLSIEELIAHCNRQLERTPTHSIHYQEHESVRAYLQMFMELGEILGASCNLDRLRELMVAEKEGCIFVSPVKRGQIVYATNIYKGLWDDRCAIACTVSSILFGADGRFSIVCREINSPGMPHRYFTEDIGRTLFLSMEDAETSLRKGE